jgi:HlyD family secretion protein
MNDMIFEGLVDESEVGKLRQGMELILNVGALEGKPFKATLEYISPKGVTDQGTIKFTIRAAVQLDKELFLRSNYSANADIVLDKRDDVWPSTKAICIIEGQGTSSKSRPRRSSSRSARSRLDVRWHQHRSCLGLKAEDKIKHR